MARTAEQIQAELGIINGALQSLYSGTRITELRIDTNILRRSHRFTEISLESLLEQKNLLEQELLALTEAAPTFRSFASIPLKVDKQGVY
jgi:hypothetical protein